MKKPKIILVAIAPFYEGKILWVEQLFDFLNIFATETLFLPQGTINQNTLFEYNALLPLIATQYPQAHYYEGDVSMTDTGVFLEAYEIAMQQFKSYFTFAQGTITLSTFNEQLYWTLGKQYETFLPQQWQTPFHILQQKLLDHLLLQLQHITTDAVVVLPIEYAAIFQETLAQSFAEQLFIYGEDFLEDETRE